MEKNWLIIFILISSFNVKAQNQNLDVIRLLDQFYEKLSIQDIDNSYLLSLKIDSLIPASKSLLDNETLAIYYNTRGILYSTRDLNPEQSFIKADSLNNLLTTPIIEVTAYSSYFLGEYYWDKNANLKAKQAYSKIIEIPYLSKEFINYKSTALDKTFLIDRTNGKVIDSIEANKTAEKLIKFKEFTHDTLNVEYGRALQHLNYNESAEQVFLNINSIKEGDNRYDKYTKFRALFWLNLYYYGQIPIDLKDITNAKKLIKVSEELISLTEDTDYLESDSMYSIFADIIVASLITKDSVRIKRYEEKILRVINSQSYPESIDLGLKRFYFTLHKLYLYFELNKDFEKAKFYSFKNVELTKLVYGDKSIEYEQELMRFEGVIRLGFFDYDEAYNISIKRGEIIKELFGENSIEYLQVVSTQYELKLNQRDHKKGLKILEKIISIFNKIDCLDEKVCEEIKYNYLECLNYNELYNESLERIREFDYINNNESLFRLAEIRRASYYGLKQDINVNREFEWLLERISGKENIFKNDENTRYYFYNFLFDYQQHLRTTGRLNKAIMLSEKYMNLFREYDKGMIRIDFRLSYVNSLFQIQQCNKALRFIEDNNILTFPDLYSPANKALKEHNYNFTLGNIYSCLENYNEAIMAYEKAITYNEIDTNRILIRLIDLNNKIKNKEKTNYYLNKYEENLSELESLDLEELYLISDVMVSIKDWERLLNYLLPLSKKVVDDICNKSFFSSDDNKFDKAIHNEVLRYILAFNSSDLFNSQLEGNAILISDLYKRRLDYFTQINIGLQKLKTNKNEDALKLQSLENKFNLKPNELILEEINQLKTKLMNSGLLTYDQLCNIDYNSIYESISENEIVIDIMSYKYKLEQVSDNFVINYLVQDNVQSFEFNLNDHLGLQNDDKIDSKLFDYIGENIFSNPKVNGDKIDTFYFIPSGSSHLMNFSAFSLYFEEKYKRNVKVHRINSLSDILKLKLGQREVIDNLILVGDIDYDKMQNTSSLNFPSKTGGAQPENYIKNSDIPFWGYLPGTKEEIENIRELASANNTDVTVLLDTEVTESNLKKKILKQKTNNILHIATHAYFFPNETDNKIDNPFTSNKNPLLNSGLILSGANKTWKNKKLVHPNNDGILTAEEISFMDLRGVELVVLSACDTGLGNLSNLEGVNGLQRAFKLAGANKLIMSLWKIPDTETSEFFSHFYNFFLKDKLSINQSFRKTQRLMKEKYSPYYWAGFVLLE